MKQTNIKPGTIVRLLAPGRYGEHFGKVIDGPVDGRYGVRTARTDYSYSNKGIIEAPKEAKSEWQHLETVSI